MNEYFSQCCLIIFTRNLIPGEIDSPLKAINSDEELFRIHATLDEHVRNLTGNFPVAKHLYYDRFIDENDTWSSQVFKKYLQEGNHEGEKRENAFRSAFEEGYRKVILITCDYGTLQAKHLEEAFLSLRIIEYSIGPDNIGNYYLIGMNQFEPIVFHNKQWNENNLYKMTIRDIGNMKYALYKLPVLKIFESETDMNNQNNPATKIA